MAHHTHSVERWLSVKDCNITVKKMTFNIISWLKFFKKLFFHFISDFFSSSIRSNNVVCSRVFFWSALDKLFEIFHVPGLNNFRDSKFHRNNKWNSNFMQRNHWIWTDNSSATEVCSFSCEVVSDTSFFAFDS